jgi:AcrR family transcriptional regulator
MRIADESKLARVKEATIQIIVKKGYHGTTISKIASLAEVSDGYLYRHYKNKSELIRDLFIENKRNFHKQILEYIDQSDTVREMLIQSCHYIRSMAAEKPEIIKFYSLLAHDYTFEFPEVIRIEIRLIGEKIREKGIITGEVSKDTQIEEIILSFFGFQGKLVDLYEKGIISDEYFNDYSSQKIVNMCLKVWK